MAIKVDGIKIIQIIWDGPKTIAEVKLCSENPDRGVYQIYGPHPVYGENVLVYIGLVGGNQDSERTFSNRIGEHEEYWLDDKYDDSRYEIYLGRLMGDPNSDKKNEYFKNKSDSGWSDEIKVAETMLILAHTPAYNSQGLNCNKKVDKSIGNYHLINLGKSRSLQIEISGAWLTDSFWGKRGMEWEKFKVYGNTGDDLKI